MLSRRAFVAGAMTAVALPRVAVAADSDTRRDIGYGAHHQQRFDAYLPKQGRRLGGAIVFLHGGGWHRGDKRAAQVWRAKAAHWTGQGLAFFSVNTRLMPEADPLEQAEDLRRALAFVQTQSTTYGIDPTRLALMGHSAGGHIAALVAATPTKSLNLGGQPLAGTVVLDSAALDLEARMRGNPGRIYGRSFGTDPRYWRAASPLALAEDGIAPMLVVCASGRRGVCASARVFGEAVLAQSGSVTVFPVNKTHREINADLGRDNAMTQRVDRFLRDIGVL